MRKPADVLRPCLTAAILFVASHAGAVEIPNVGGEPMQLDVVNTAALSYRFNNRNDDPRYPTRYLDDNYGEFFDRLDAQLNWWRLQLGVRLNTWIFFNRPSATGVDLLRKMQTREVLFNSNDAVRELNTRYLTTVYPTKLWLTYSQPGLEITAGDFYAQLGRGLVFSVRKLDELALDTTVRGGKIVFDQDLGPVRLGATAFAGLMNPLRVDLASGRRIQGDGSPLFFGFPGRDSTGDLRYYETAQELTTEKARPNYLEDTVVGGRLEATFHGVQLAANGLLLTRKSYTEEFNRCAYEQQADEQRSPGNRTIGLCANKFPEFDNGTAAQEHDTIRSFSGSVSVPSIAEHGDLYVEVAGQQLRDGHLSRFGVPQPDLSGYAVYAAANARGGPVALSLEGKHYWRFVPLSANIDVNVLSNPGFNAPEFNVVAYNQPPTAEPFYMELNGAPNICVTGGRGRLDYRFNRSTALYAWVGRYVSFSELDDRNFECKTDEKHRTDMWDMATGAQIDFEGGRSHVRAWTGGRHSRAGAPFISQFGSSDVFYSEGYLRYDVVKHLAGSFSVQSQGVHRRRYLPKTFGLPWVEGDNYLALQWSPHIAAIFGYEYSTQQGCKPRSNGELCHFFNGGLQWKSASSHTILEQLIDTVQVFVGQRRGGLRCVSGVCRFFPPFEGARVDLVSKF